MTKIISYIASPLLGVALSAAGQGVGTGNNNGGPVSLESQTGAPVGQTDFQTDLFTGRFGYTVPLDVAPARHDSAPNLELLYNSANGNGLCGVGWDLDLGYIERETKYGVPVAWSGGHALTQYDDSKGFVFSFRNKTSDLIQIPGGAYRSQVESDFMQFQLNGNEWVVTDKSGNQYFFGSSSSSRMINPKSGWSSTLESGTFRWALDTIVTATGDTASISYTKSGNRLYPSAYTYNGHSGGVSQLCKLQFTMTNRPDVTISCRSAFAVTNLYLLSSVLHTVNSQNVWQYNLNYTVSPSTDRSLLASVIRYGTDLSSTLPPITFGYSQQSYTFRAASYWTNLCSPTNGSAFTPYYYSFNNPLADLVDVNGDGLPDRIVGPCTGLSTNWWVQYNTGSGFGPSNYWTIGSQSYQGNATSNFYDWADVGAGHGRVIDINGDGRPDFIVDPLESYLNNGLPAAMKTNYSRLVVQLNNSTNLLSQSSWTNVIDQWTNSFGQTTVFRAVDNGTYVAMLDMNGDGLPDRVMIRPGSPYTNYYVQFNTGTNFSGTNSFGPYAAQGATSDLDYAGLVGKAGNTGSGVSMRMLDINGDGLPDRVMLVYSGGTAPGTSQTYLVVELNNGYGFEPAMNWTNVDNLAISCGGGTLPGISDLGDGAFVALRDVNGDGLPDRVLACWCSAGTNPYTTWMVQINTGTGFANAINWGPVASQSQLSNTNYCGIESSMIPAGQTTPTGTTLLLDINGDGLPDRVEYAYTNAPTNHYSVELSSGPFPDLLTTASNGLGGVVTATYVPSTHWDNREVTNATLTRYLLPFPIYTVSSISVGDGFYPLNTTTYTFSGGFWSPTLRQFNGFAQATVVDPLGLTQVHWFHQAGGRNNSAFGEFADSTNAIGKEGMEYRTDTIGSNGLPYKLVLNQVNETTLNGGAEHFAYITTNIEIDYPASSSSYNATARGYGYNLSNGNLTNTTNWGAVQSLNTANESFSDFAGDTVYQITQFATFASYTNIADKPSSVTLSTDAAGANILRQRLYSYDGTSAENLSQTRDVTCVSNGVIEYRTNSYTYDTSGYNNLATHTDPTGVTTQITTYDTIFETYPSQTVVGGILTSATTYDARSGKLGQSTDPMGLVTLNTYDAFLRLSETQVSTTSNGTPSDWLEKYTYTLSVVSGAPQNSIYRQQSDGVDLSNGHETYTYYDGLGRTIQLREESERSGYFRAVDTVYDKRGNVEFTSLPYFSSGTARSLAANGLGTLRGYDPVGRQVQLTGAVPATFGSGLLTGFGAPPYGDGSSSPVGTSSIAFYTNNNPWIWTVTDEAGTSHQYTLDAYGRTNQIVEAPGSLNYTNLLQWNLAGDLLSVTDNAQNVIQYSNNMLGEVIAMADPDMGVWQYQRDFAGRIRHQIDGDGQRIDFVYSGDPLGRLVSRQVYDIKTNFNYGVTNYYDSEGSDTGFLVGPGQLYKTLDNQGYTKYGYDIRGRKVVTSRYLATNATTYTTQYGYDDMDRVTSTVYPNSGPTIVNVYDTGANLSVVKQGSTAYYSANGSTAFTALDQIQQITYGNSVTASYTYYANSQRLDQLTTGSAQSLTYTYDKAGDILSIADGVYSGTASAALSSVGYDALHRLTSLGRNGTTYNFGYDSIGDLTNNTEAASGGYSYSTPKGTHLPHAVKSVNGWNYSYDLCGNMLSRGSQALVYNPENRLIAVAGSNMVVYFGYDAAGARLWKQGNPTNSLQVWIGNIYEEKNGKKLFHIYAGDRLVYTYSSDNSVQEYYYPDHLHSAEVLSGTASQHYEYTAYGQLRYTANAGAFPVTRRYASQQFDDETGLYYYGARYYDPLIGRFVQPDTTIPNLFNPQAFDRYAYCYDNPLKYFDPDGHAGYWADVGQVWLGFYDAGAGLVHGSISMVAHPIMTVEGVGAAVAHPLITAESIAGSVSTEWDSGFRGQGDVVGNVLIVVGSAVAPGAQGTGLAKIQRISSAASKAEDVSTAIETATKQGGAYKDLTTEGMERHHIPSKAASPLSRDEGPAVRMDPADHRRTESFGRRKSAQDYRNKQAELIQQGKFKEAQDMDVQDIQSKFGNKYDKGVKEAQDYTKSIPTEKLTPNPPVIGNQ